MRIPPASTWQNFKHAETQSLVRDWSLPPGVSPADLMRPYDRALYAEIQAAMQRCTYQWQHVEACAHARRLDLRTYYTALSLLTLHLRRTLKGHDTPPLYPVVACRCGHFFSSDQDTATCYQCHTDYTWTDTHWQRVPENSVSLGALLAQLPHRKATP